MAKKQAYLVHTTHGRSFSCGGISFSPALTRVFVDDKLAGTNNAQECFVSQVSMLKIRQFASRNPKILACTVETSSGAREKKRADAMAELRSANTELVRRCKGLEDENADMRRRLATLVSGD